MQFTSLLKAGDKECWDDEIKGEIFDKVRISAIFHMPQHEIHPVKKKQRVKPEPEVKAEQGRSSVKREIPPEGVGGEHEREEREELERGSGRPSYDCFSNQVLIGLCSQKDSKIDKLLGQLKSLKKQCDILRHWKNRAKSRWASAKASQRKKRPSMKSDAFHCGRKNRKLSVHGGHTLALMRAVNGGAAWKTGASCQTDAAGCTIGRWEALTDAGLSAGYIEQMSSNSKTCAVGAQAGKLAYEIHSIRSDGTNAKVLHKESLNVCAVASRHVVINECFEIEHDESDEMFSDLLVQTSKSAAAAYANVLKQVKSCGVETWRDEKTKFEELIHRNDDGTWSWKSGASPQKAWKVYQQCTDCGSDQKSGRETAAWEICEVPWCLGLGDSDCKMHQVQLITRTLLSNAAKIAPAVAPEESLPPFFSGIATISNTLREFSSQVFRGWVAKFGLAAAKAAVKRLPPRCISGRWGSAAEFVKWLLSLPIEQLRVVLALVLEGKDEGAVIDPAHFFDETALDDSKHFIEKRGRWVATTLKCIMCPAYCTILQCVFPFLCFCLSCCGCCNL